MNKKVDLKDILVQLTPEEIAENRRIIEIKEILGIPMYIDSNTSNKNSKEYIDPYFEITDSQFSSINTQYKNFAEYDNDKYTAEKLMRNNEPVPPDLFNKLVQTRIELEQAGLLPVYKEDKKDD